MTAAIDAPGRRFAVILLVFAAFAILILVALLWQGASPVSRSVLRGVGMRPAPRTFADRLAYAAEDIVDPTIIYDPTYTRLAYPGGDVSPRRGVCADVIIRAYRRLGIDLQVLVHEDMRRHFGAYPRLWQLRRPDANIDHRRVYNLATFFRRHGTTLPCTTRGADYAPGDIVVWRVQNQGHIGLVSSQRDDTHSHYLMVHNIGGGQVLEDVLFAFPIIGHYRYAPVRARI